MSSQEKSGLKKNPCKMPHEFCEDLGIFFFVARKEMSKRRDESMQQIRYILKIEKTGEVKGLK